MLKLLQSVLDRAHKGHRYVSDQEQYSLREHWTESLEGDCEDFALSVRKMLKKHNIESDLVFCLTETGTGHLVVSVDGWILDNRNVFVRRQQYLPYTWIKLGKPDGRWYEILEDKEP